MKRYELEINKRYTIVLPNELVPETHQCTLINWYFSSFAQHQNSLFLFIKRKGCRKINRIVIHKNSTAFILKGWQGQNSWRKEEVSKSEQSTVSRLHRLTISDFKASDVVLNKQYGEEFQVQLNNDVDGFYEYTGDYLQNNNVKFADQPNNEGYLNYIAELVRKFNYNVDGLMKSVEFPQLKQCLKLALDCNWC